MNKILQGTVVKAVGGVFDVISNGTKYVCFSPKKLRYNDLDILVGDSVLFEDLHKGKGVVTDVLPRKNRLTRPEVANIDVCFIVLAHEPQPDFFLADKVLINCFQQNILPVIVINKTDVTDETHLLAESNYHGICDIVCTSATKDGNADVLLQYLQDGKVACFAGQSAVGKTSLLNALLPNNNAQVGAVSEKSGRGTHTTRHSSLHRVGNGFVTDTCGFSLCDLQGIKSYDLHLYLDDFVQVASGCKFTSCTHTAEPFCAVKQAVQDGKLNAQRYERYLEEYNQLVEQEKKQY